MDEAACLEAARSFREAESREELLEALQENSALRRTQRPVLSFVGTVAAVIVGLLLFPYVKALLAWALELAAALLGLLIAAAHR